MLKGAGIQSRPVFRHCWKWRPAINGQDK